MQEIRARLQSEIKELERELRQELPREIQKAREMGDLRENAEYKAALERQSYVRSRIGQLQRRLEELSRLNLDALPKDRIHLGSLVRVLDLETNAEATYELVIAENADASQGRISIASPVARGLVGKEEGDEVRVRTPSGVRNFEIVSVKTLHDRRDGADSGE